MYGDQTPIRIVCDECGTSSWRPAISIGTTIERHNMVRHGGGVGAVVDPRMLGRLAVAAEKRGMRP